MPDHAPAFATNKSPLKIKTALLSVSDKTGIAELAKALAERGVTLISTGGTARLLRDNGLTVRDVAEITGSPEMMDGRVKTLHPKVHGGLLALRDYPQHAKDMQTHGIEAIDLLVVNLYPFEQTIRQGADYDLAVENIDIGGPAMIRAAAKNHGYVAVVTDPQDYGKIIEEMAGEGVGFDSRQRFAAKAFAKTASYDLAIATWFGGERGDDGSAGIIGEKIQDLRYGENPHQRAAFYRAGQSRAGVTTARQLQGKALSYNNINDTDAAFELVAEFDRAIPAVAIIKHANPCGVAMGKTLMEAYGLALRSDPVSAFGGIVAVNQKLDGDAAREMVKIFTEVVIAPDATTEAIEVFAAKKNLRLLITGGLPDPEMPGEMIKQVAGGFLRQSRDNGQITENDLKIVTQKAPDAGQMRDLLFAFQIAKHVKSNAIVYVKDGASVGIGAGQMSRLDSSHIAARKAEDAAQAAGLPQSLAIGSVVASDAFFPFPDGLLAAAEAGAKAVIQPGGSIKDKDVIAAADDAGLAMVFTGMRHFRH